MVTHFINKSKLELESSIRKTLVVRSSESIVRVARGSLARFVISKAWLDLLGSVAWLLPRRSELILL